VGLFDKVKNLFTEEVEEDEPIKKEVIQVEIPSPKEQKKERRIVKEEIESLDEVEVIEEEPSFEPVKEEPKEEYKFPFFDDDDFSALETEKPVKETKRKSSYRKESSYKKEAKEVYSPVKEEKKIFKHPE